MSDELKPYRLSGLRFVHDSRGKYIRDGGLAFLSDDKARKILSALKKQGRPNCLVLEAPEPSVDKVDEAQSQIDTTQSEQGPQDELISVDILGVALALHFTKRKLLASMISGGEVENTPEADEIIKSADVSTIEALIEEIAEG